MKHLISRIFILLATFQFAYGIAGFGFYGNQDLFSVTPGATSEGNVSVIPGSLDNAGMLGVYFYIDAQHNFYYLISDTVFDAFNIYSEFHFSQIILGIGPTYGDYLISNEIALIALMLMYGIVGFTIFLFLFILLPINIGINLERSDRIYILIILLLFISLIHYNASIRGGFLFLYISFLSIIFGKWVNRFNA